MSIFIVQVDKGREQGQTVKHSLNSFGCANTTHRELQSSQTLQENWSEVTESPYHHLRKNNLEPLTTKGIKKILM